MLGDGTWSYEWQHGRQLDSMSNGTTTVNFDYDASGMRIRKAIGTNVWRYTYNGSTLSHMTDGTNTLYFSYDSNGAMAVNYNGTMYYYVQNAQGDVIALVNSSGSEVVSYTYGPWGKLLFVGGSMKDTLGQHNPLRYRGYVYDTETGLYYLQTRYYNPEMGRFITADSQLNEASILGYNLFAYCYNNPISFFDNDGREAISICLGVLACAAILVIGCMAIDMLNDSMPTIIDGFEKGLNSLNASIKRIKEGIEGSFARAKQQTKPKRLYEIHHLVAKKAHNASYAARILNEVLEGGVENEANKLVIKYGLHRRLHTNGYYGWANSVVISAYNSANGNRNQQRINVLAALATIRAYVRSLNAMAPY
ncbi:MAG: RHS repeat-associated core domain-containing protein [Ruminococcaceae bacterium]|nr:RHS repeat-associated core domain-containing protein [Oscillospiraceae bacterium]